MRCFAPMPPRRTIWFLTKPLSRPARISRWSIRSVRISGDRPRRAAFNTSLDDQGIARLVASQRVIDFVDGRLLGLDGKPKVCRTRGQLARSHDGNSPRADQRFQRGRGNRRSHHGLALLGGARTTVLGRSADGGSQLMCVNESEKRD